MGRLFKLFWITFGTRNVLPCEYKYAVIVIWLLLRKARGGDGCHNKISNGIVKPCVHEMFYCIW